MTVIAHPQFHPCAQPQPQGCHHLVEFSGARLSAYARSLATVVRVDGELDASNSDDVVQTINRFARLKSPLVLDLSQVTFVGVDGLRTLLALNADLRRARVHFTVVTGPAMRPLLRIVADHGLSLADSVAEALQMIHDVVQARRQVLSDLVRRRSPARRAAAS